MKYIVFITLLIFSIFSIFLSSAIAADGYVPVDPSSIETTGGNTLLFVSYGIVLGLLIAYWGYMAYQTHKTSHRISHLEREPGR